jgi:hypothetical protein
MYWSWRACHVRWARGSASHPTIAHLHVRRWRDVDVVDMGAAIYIGGGGRGVCARVSASLIHNVMTWRV